MMTKKELNKLTKAQLVKEILFEQERKELYKKDFNEQLDQRLTLKEEYKKLKLRVSEAVACIKMLKADEIIPDCFMDHILNRFGQSDSCIKLKDDSKHMLTVGSFVHQGPDGVVSSAEINVPLPTWDPEA